MGPGANSQSYQKRGDGRGAPFSAIPAAARTTQKTREALSSQALSQLCLQHCQHC